VACFVDRPPDEPSSAKASLWWMILEYSCGKGNFREGDVGTTDGKIHDRKELVLNILSVNGVSLLRSL
jgi:hypothetical protein